MSLLLNVIFASHARSTHHKLALDALRHLQGDEAAQWADVLISQHAAYLGGAKAPDDDFKDFKNHVLHVKENSGAERYPQQSTGMASSLIIFVRPNGKKRPMQREC